jgi:hypothetical protein
VYVYWQLIRYAVGRGDRYDSIYGNVCISTYMIYMIVVYAVVRIYIVDSST